MVKRVIVFVDYDNLLFQARTAFPQCKDPALPDHVFGQFDPITLGRVLCERSRDGAAWNLHQTRIYTGMPSRTKEPRPHSARLAQCNAWTKQGAVVLQRSLQYLPDWPKTKPQQKGVDVALALDFVMFAVERYYDIGVLVSMDTDMVPALKYVHQRCSADCEPQVAAWRSPIYRKRLSLPGQNVWCHFVEEGDFKRVMDPRDYLPPAAKP